MKEVKFYVCETCGNLVGMINESGVPMMCCGKKMQQIVPGTVEASKEKHIPVATLENGVLTVNVGSVDHPMTEEHLIEWVYVQTDRGGQRKVLNAGDAPNLTFVFDDEKPLAVYAYCNLHGLWKTEL
ncbi:MAG: desulfoferrodoxin [Clostridia bacterium]|nr:desulfoferrodoxin [Clostridia bacterium]